MYRIESKIQPSSAAFKENAAFQREASARLRARLDEVKNGGPAVDTRQAVALAISLSLNAPIPDHRFGVFRM